MSVSTFYTLFWILYFPLCIAFYDTIPSLQYSDELLTLLLVVVTALRFNKLRQRMAKNEIAVFILLMAFYVGYSLSAAVNVSSAVWLDLQQQVRPYAVFYCTWLLAPQFSRRQRNLILLVMLLTYVVYTMAFLFAPSLVIKYGTSESVAIGLLAMLCSMTYYLFKPHTRRNLLLCLLIMATGLLGGKSKFYGETVCFVAIFFFLKGRIKFGSLKTMAQFAAITAVVLFFTWTKFNAYYIEGMSDEYIQNNDESSRMARPESYKTAMTIIFKDYIPFGSGLGTFGTNAAAVHYSPLYYDYDLNEIWGLDPMEPMFLADAFYPTLAEYGLVGLFFFLIFWKRRLMAVRWLPDDNYYKVGLMCILALALESTADTTYLSGKGMGYFMLLGMCLSSKDIWLQNQSEASKSIAAEETAAGSSLQPQTETSDTKI